uniref:Secreted protein n=1 Tax=Physcomitrium patens TaxID=3218 RepID=A0A7I3ZAD8_PHYPA
MLTTPPILSPCLPLLFFPFPSVLLLFVTGDEALGAILPLFPSHAPSSRPRELSSCIRCRNAAAPSTDVFSFETTPSLKHDVDTRVLFIFLNDNKNRKGK